MPSFFSQLSRIIIILTFLLPSVSFAAEKGGCICYIGNQGETSACINNMTSAECDAQENKIQQTGKSSDILGIDSALDIVGSAKKNLLELKNCFFYPTNSGSCGDFTTINKEKNETGLCSCQVAGKNVEKYENVNMLKCGQYEFNLKQNNKSGSLDCAFNKDKILNIAGVSSNEQITSAGADTGVFTPITVKPPRLNIPIPNLPQFSEIPPPQTTGDEIVVPWLGQYFAAAYQYFVGIAVIIAIVLIMIGGIQWLTAGGSAEHLGSAKKRITNAITGLIIALGSYLILYTINPEILEFKALRLSSISRKELEFTEEQHAANSKEGTQKSSGYDPQGQNEVQFQECLQAKPSQKFTGPNVANKIKYDFLDKVQCGSKGTRSLKAKNGKGGVTHVVLHEGGQTSKIVNYWNSLCEQSSNCYGTHFNIEQDGTIYQIEGIDGYVAHGNKVSSYSIGIDLNIGISSAQTSDKCIKLNAKKSKADAITACTPKYSSAMLSSIAALIKDLSAQTEIKVQSDRILAHCMWMHGDPRGLKWEELGKFLGISMSSEEKGQISNYAKQACWFGDKYDKRLNFWADKFGLK